MAESPKSTSLPDDPAQVAAFWQNLESPTGPSGWNPTVNGDPMVSPAAQPAPGAATSFHGAETMSNLSFLKADPSAAVADLLVPGVGCAPSLPQDLLRSHVDLGHSAAAVVIPPVAFTALDAGQFSDDSGFYRANCKRASVDADPAAEVIGRGAHGTVELADAPDGTRLARKRIPLHSSGHLAADSRSGVRAELHVCEALIQRPRPQFPRIFAVAVGGTEAVVDMEYLSGGSAADLAPLEGPALRRICGELCSAVAVLHDDLGVVHRDIKPENVLMDAAGCAKLGDFGCAAVVAADSGAGPCATDQRGTTAYMSPERLCGEPHGFASDVWALGVTIAVLATGRHPFLPADGASSSVTDRFWQLAEVLHHTSSTEDCEAATRRSVAAAMSSVSDHAVVRLVELCTRADPSERPTARALLAMMQHDA